MRQTLILTFLALAAVAQAQIRQERNLDKWQFSRDGKDWQQVDVPHDWAITGPFDRKWDIQHLAIEQDGQTEAVDHTGRSGALPWIGKGEYRTTFNLPAGTKHTTLYFDGAMSEPVVYVNGREAGRWMYGYNAFRLDITPYVKAGENEVRVLLNNQEESSRWYPGAGLYRPVTLITAGDARIDPWATVFKTLSLAGNKAQLYVETQATTWPRKTLQSTPKARPTRS